MKNLEIDIETFSSVNLAKSGVYRYVESPDFEILLFGYSVDGGEVKVIDLASGETLPKEIHDALEDDSVTKWAFNAQFERICLSRFLGYPTGEYLDSEGWKCSMVWGLPLSLEGVGAVLGLEKQKLTEGKDLIRYFCVPCSPTKTNGGRTRNLPEHDMEKWERFKAYNIRDVEAEMQIQERLVKFPVPDSVWEEYHLDQEINDRGILVDMPFVEQCIEIDRVSRDSLTAAMQELTELDNPNSVVQMKGWLADNGLETDTLGKKAAALMKEAPDHLAEVLALHQQLAKSSVKKYQAMQNSVCVDNRVRGMFQFYGANRTGRFAGRLVQLQNLPQNHMSDLAEARVIAWFAGEAWRSEVFKSGGDIYCASASQMLGVPVEKHGINGHLRQKGKIAELALGYGGSVGALKEMGALEMGLTEEELPDLVSAWRQSNPNIVRFWWDVDSAVKKAIKEKTTQSTHGISFCCRSGMLFIQLPSGRVLSYVKPRMGENKFGGESVTYEGVGGTKKWERLESYGPKFVENIVQATSRDILMYAMRTLRCCSIVAHVHDELTIEADPRMNLSAVCEQMARVPSWAEGLLLRADGYICDFYKKD